LDTSDPRRLSVSLIDLGEGHEPEFLTLVAHFETILVRQDYGRLDVIRDEGHPLRFYAVRYWNSATAAELCHRDPDVQMLTARLYQVARVTHVVNGVQRPDAVRRLLDERRARVEGDRRSGFDRRVVDIGRAEATAARAIGDWGHGASATEPAKSTWSTRHAARASMPTPRSRSSRSAPRSRRPMGRSSPAATSRTRPTA